MIIENVYKYKLFKMEQHFKFLLTSRDVNEKLTFNQYLFLDVYNYIKENQECTFDEYYNTDSFPKLSKLEFESIKTFFEKNLTFSDFVKSSKLDFVPFLSHIYTNEIKIEKNLIEAINIIQEWFIFHPAPVSYKYNDINVKLWLRNLIQHNQDEWELILSSCNRELLYKTWIFANMIGDYITSTYKNIPPESIWHYPKFLQTSLSYTYNLYIKKENIKHYPFLDLVLPYEHSPINNFLRLHKTLII